MTWTTGTLFTPDGSSMPVMIPAMTDEEAETMAGVSVTVSCRAGCSHLLAMGPDFHEAMELACCRLALAPGWSAGVLVVGVFPGETRTEYVERKAENDAWWRGKAS